MIESVDCVVIGAGVVGLAIARELALRGREVVILEAEEAFGTHTSSRNSEVIHAGIYYPTGSHKARLCVSGRKALYRYCAEKGIAHRRIGKVIVATDESQLENLRRYKEQGETNGVDDLRFLSRSELSALEPAVLGVAGILSPSTGIIDSHGLMLAYLGDAEEHGAMLALKSPVICGKMTDDGIELNVGGEEPMTVLCGTLVNSAGLHAQALARRIAGIPPETIPPTYYAIGHYYSLAGTSPFGHLVYPVARQDWLGVHVTLDLAARCKFGPDFAWIDRIDYTFNAQRETVFYEAIRRYFPGLKDGQLQPGYTGIRPKIHGPGTQAPDFMIQGPADHHLKGLVNLYGIESPGLTSSLAIAKYVAELLNGQQFS